MVVVVVKTQIRLWPFIYPPCTRRPIGSAHIQILNATVEQMEVYEHSSYHLFFFFLCSLSYTITHSCQCFFYVFLTLVFFFFRVCDGALLDRTIKSKMDSTASLYIYMKWGRKRKKKNWQQQQHMCEMYQDCRSLIIIRYLFEMNYWPFAPVMEEPVTWCPIQ